MTDQEFLRAFEQHTLTEFPHRSHIRMAWLYLRASGLERGQDQIRQEIQRFAAALGANQKYHETITVFWARIVYHAIECDPGIDTFNAFIERYPFLLNSKLHATHYSRDLIASEAARQRWIEPDLRPLP